jgi:anhydro-N-acetylmuramic acid kinase
VTSLFPGLSSQAKRFIGIMSGTSLDGADAVLADFSSSQPIVIAFESVNFDTALKRELLALNSPGDNEIERASVAANKLVDAYASVVNAVLQRAAIKPHEVTAVGCHGQTVRHRPDLGFTTQLNNPARLAELVGIDVVADFRSRDVAAGGQGAPFAPAFHDGVFRREEPVVVANIGGIANLTILEPNNPVRGFDCGPGNVLMDAWTQRHLNQPYDADGAWASQGQSSTRLFEAMKRERYFHDAPPKSTGRDLFCMDWLMPMLDPSESAADVQATLLALTAWGITDHIKRFAPQTKRVLVCGGGAHNRVLMASLASGLPLVTVEQTDAHGVPAQQVEALAFAWLAKQFVERRAIDFPAITGARHGTIAGALYPR